LFSEISGNKKKPARIAQRKMPLFRQVVDINLLVRAALEMVEHEIRDRKMQIVLHLLSTPIWVDVEDMGHSTVKANSVASAVDILTREKFDLIISDIGLPDGNGVSLIHAVRAFCDAPAIALTGYGMREDVERCLNAGFNKHITKPVTFEVLAEGIAEVCCKKSKEGIEGNP
jgi:CheY-like chemotaxis protein